MIKKLSAALIVMSLAVIDQSASAQKVVPTTTQDVTLATVYPIMMSTGTPAVKLTDGKIWIFKQMIGIKLDGKDVLPTALKPGMKCVLTGMPGIFKYPTILSLDCKTS